MVIVHHSPPLPPVPHKNIPDGNTLWSSFLLCKDLIITFQAFMFGQALSSVSTDTKVKVKA